MSQTSLTKSSGVRLEKAAVAFDIGSIHSIVCCLPLVDLQCCLYEPRHCFSEPQPSLSSFNNLLHTILHVATWESHKAKVNHLLLFGDCVLSIDVKGNIFIWAFKGITENNSPVGHISLGNNFTPSCIMHPDTYMNKVIVGSREGSLQQWNISTKTKLYEFKGWSSAISCSHILTSSRCCCWLFRWKDSCSQYSI